jgi:hypothetical protein
VTTTCWSMVPIRHRRRSWLTCSMSCRFTESRCDSVAAADYSTWYRRGSS